MNAIPAVVGARGWKSVGAAVLVVAASACSGGSATAPAAAPTSTVPSPGLHSSATTVPPAAAPGTTSPATATAAADAAASSVAGVYAATTGRLAPSVADIPSRVYVPNSDAGTVSVIDPATFEVIDTFHAGKMPHHVIPSWDMQTLFVLDTAGNGMTPIDPRTGQPGPRIDVADPYNLYFTPDGSTAIVVAERYRRLDLRDPHTWELRASIDVPNKGVNHGDFSPDGRYFYASCEFSGYVVKVDLVEQRVVAEIQAGVEPIDVKLSPDAQVIYVADQVRNGVILLDPNDLTEIGFIPTGKGAHGMYLSRAATQLYVSNRKGGSVSVIDLASRSVSATWEIPGGGSPDMGGVSIDGSQLWLGGRYNAEVYVFDTTTGEVTHQIPTGAGSHGVSVFPQPGRYSLGHTGVYR
jgi:YVTN family beta-propeller protein